MMRRGANHPVYQLRDEMDRLFNGFFPSAARAANAVSGRSFPAMNVWEHGDQLFVEAEVPGLTGQQIEISVVGNSLTIQGNPPAVEAASAAGAAVETFHRRERAVGGFTRSIALPVEIDAEQVSAKLENGVLLITLPKAEKAKPRKVQVNVT